MFGFEVVPFDRDHITLNDLRIHEQRLLISWGNYRERLLALGTWGPSWSAFKDGKHVCSGGVAPISLRVGEAWQLPSKDVADHLFSYAKLFKHFAEMLFEQGQYRRLQTICLDDRLHNRWMKFCGFEKEGVMRQYGQYEEDYGMFARLKDGR